MAPDVLIKQEFPPYSSWGPATGRRRIHSFHPCRSMRGQGKDLLVATGGQPAAAAKPPRSRRQTIVSGILPDSANRIRPVGGAFAFSERQFHPNGVRVQTSAAPTID